MLHYTEKRKNDLIWLKFKYRPGSTGRCPASLDRPANNFRNRQFRSVSEQFRIMTHFPHSWGAKKILFLELSTMGKMSEFSSKKCPVKCPIRNFWQKNRPNGFEWVWIRLKLFPGQSKLSGHRPDDPGRSLNLSHMRSVLPFFVSERNHALWGK